MKVSIENILYLILGFSLAGIIAELSFMTAYIKIQKKKSGQVDMALSLMGSMMREVLERKEK
jgi:hypothetical protein